MGQEALIQLRWILGSRLESSLNSNFTVKRTITGNLLFDFLPYPIV